MARQPSYAADDRLENHISNLSFWIHVNNHCNLDCSYCFVSKFRATMSTTLSIVPHRKFDPPWTLLVAKRLGLTHACYQRLVVLAQFFQHVGGADVVLIVVANALASSDMGDRYGRGVADLSEPLSDRVRPSSSRLLLAI